MPRKKQAEAEQPPAQISHNSELSDDALIAENHKIDELIKAAQEKFNEWAKPHVTRRDEIENILLARLQERKANNTKTDSGTAYISHPMTVKIEDQAALFDWIADNWDEVSADTKLSLKVDAIRTYMEKNEGKAPPGLKIGYATNLNINRS
jgi:acyl-CoA reductase-like NAD-dependent aldehyde dehydrogenase